MLEIALTSWVAQITVNYKLIFLGHFDKEQDAAAAYNAAAIKHFGAFASLNDATCIAPEKRCVYSSRTRGVSYHKKSRHWRAYAIVDGRQRHIGMFASEEEAIEGRLSFLSAS